MDLCLQSHPHPQEEEVWALGFPDEEDALVP